MTHQIWNTNAYRIAHGYTLQALIGLIYAYENT